MACLLLTIAKISLANKKLLYALPIPEKKQKKIRYSLYFNHRTVSTCFSFFIHTLCNATKLELGEEQSETLPRSGANSQVICH